MRRSLLRRSSRSRMEFESVRESFALGIWHLDPTRRSADVAGAVEIQPSHDLAALFVERNVEWPIARLRNGGGFAHFRAVAEHAFEFYLTRGADSERAGAIVLRMIRVTIARAWEGEIIFSGK